MSPNIQREAELFLCAQLSSALPSIQFFPFIGFGDNNIDLEPPFVVVAVGSAEKTLAQENTFIATGTVQIVDHIDMVTAENHSLMVRHVYNALQGIQPQVPSADFSFHGLDIDSVKSASDAESKAYADVINFVAGVGG